jgi:hypothetical protein
MSNLSPVVGKISMLAARVALDAAIEAKQFDEPRCLKMEGLDHVIVVSPDGEWTVDGSRSTLTSVVILLSRTAVRSLARRGINLDEPVDPEIRIEIVPPPSTS